MNRGDTATRLKRVVPFLRFRSAPWWRQSVPLLLYGTVATLALLILPRGVRGVQLFIACAQMAAAAWGVAACWTAARCVPTDEPFRRRPWFLLGAALSCSAIGVLIHFFFDLIGARVPRFPSPSDLFWVWQAPLAALALFHLAWWRLTRPSRHPQIFRIFIDTFIVTLSVLALSWATLLEPRLSGRLPLLSRGLLIYYPLADSVLLFGAVLLFLSSRERLHTARAAGLMLLGTAVWIGTNALYFLLLLRGQNPASGFSTGTALDAGWIWAALLMGAAALAHNTAQSAAQAGELAGESTAPAAPDEDYQAYFLRHGGRDAESDSEELRERLWQKFFIIWLPYLAAIGVALLLIAREYSGGSVQTVMRMLPALSLLLAIVARQMLTLWDNTRLSERLREANLSLEQVNFDLEQNVYERTQHLATLHGITSTLNTSLDRRTVLRVALERTIAATQATGGGIWLRTAEDENATTIKSPGEARGMSWKLAHAHGFDGNETLENMLRDLAIAAADDGSAGVSLLPSTRLAMQYGFALSPHNVVLVPIRWGGAGG